MSPVHALAYSFQPFSDHDCVDLSAYFPGALLYQKLPKPRIHPVAVGDMGGDLVAVLLISLHDQSRAV